MRRIVIVMILIHLRVKFNLDMNYTDRILKLVDDVEFELSKKLNEILLLAESPEDNVSVFIEAGETPEIIDDNHDLQKKLERIKFLERGIVNWRETIEKDISSGVIADIKEYYNETRKHAAEFYRWIKTI